MTYQHEEAIKSLKIRAADARRLADNLDIYAKQLESDKEISLDEKYSWAINTIENFIRNINFAQLARHCRNIS